MTIEQLLEAIEASGNPDSMTVGEYIGMTSRLEKVKDPYHLRRLARYVRELESELKQKTPKSRTKRKTPKDVRDWLERAWVFGDEFGDE